MKRSFFGNFYGFDTLSILLLGIGVLLNLIPLLMVEFAEIPEENGLLYIGLLGFLPLGICIFRFFSGNHERRWEENAIILDWMAPVDHHMNERKELKEQKKVFKFFDCPNCKLRIRVPKGKGRIEITCPKCETRFIKKT